MVENWGSHSELLGAAEGQAPTGHGQGTCRANERERGGSQAADAYPILDHPSGLLTRLLKQGSDLNRILQEVFLPS